MPKHCTFGRILPKVFWHCTISLFYIFINIFPFQVFHSPAFLFEHSDNDAFLVSNRQDICPACFHIITLFLFPYNLICVLSFVPFVFRIYFNSCKTLAAVVQVPSSPTLNAKSQPQIVQVPPFSSLNAQFQPQIVQNSAFPSLNAQFQPDCAGFALSGSKCIISPWNYAKQKMFLGISSRQSAALVISHFPQAHAPHPCEVFLLYKRSLSFKTNKKEARSQASSPAAGRLISPILFQPMAILAERFYVIGRTVL